MRRAVGLLVTVSLSVAACGKSSPPKAFPGTATDKARELVRREAALGVRVGTVDSTARAYGTGGDGFCAEGRPERRRSLGVFGRTARDRARALARANLVVDVYCPWLPRFRTARR